MTIDAESNKSDSLGALDLEDPTSQSEFSSTANFEPRTQPYNHQQHQESFRGWVAIVLIILLVLIIFFCFCYLSDLPKEDPTVAFNNLIQILQIVFGPVVTLVATVVGYYFGANSKFTKS